MSDTRRAPLLGRIALQLEMVSHDDLARATREQARRGAAQGDGAPPLGELMVELGLISSADLRRLLRAREQIVARHRARREGGASAAAPTASAEGRPGAPAEARAAPASEPSRASAAVPARAAPAAAEDPEAREALAALLRRAVEREASDVHVHSGAPPRLRLAGRFVRDGEEPVAPEWAERLCRAALEPEQRERFDAEGELDFCLTLPDTGRFRANVYRQQRGTDGVFRVLPARPPTLDELGLPQDLARLTNFHQGLVLLTGPANCGKSATLAALVDILNEERREHVLTVEDPIEVLHSSKRCLVNQRSVGPHTGSFARALRAALREDPDVIVIGELRDLETISLALTAAETGHLVLGTLHTRGAIRTLNRIIGVFPADQQEQIRSMVSESLRAVVSQRLVPRAEGTGRVPALEILYVTKAVGNLIRENKTFQIHSILQTGASQGMGLLDGSLARLVAEGTVSAEEALRFAEDPRRIRS